MTVGSWDLAIVFAKWLVLMATAGAVGGTYALVLAKKLLFADRRPVYSHLQKCGLTGLLGTLLWFLLQIGAVNRSGLAGMFDVTMGKVLLQSGLGDTVQARLLGFAGLLLFTLRPVAMNLPPWPERAVHAGIAVVLIASFGDTGHVSVLSGFARSALGLHVLAVFLWIGALYPLLQLSRAPELLKVQELMRVFGKQALGIVAVLFISGLYLATQLLQAPSDLLTTPYGRVLLLKLFGVYGVLMFAAMNKLLLVPRLVTAGSATGLQKSIRMEWIVALLVLAVTSWLTTVTGPAGM